MAATKEEIKELAEHIYDLDAEVYRVLGSSLGRVFNSDRDMTVRRLATLMGDFTQGHYLRSELALISNMARTIPVKADRSRLMTEYNEILHALDKLPTNFNSLDILDPKMAHLNSLQLDRRFDQGNHLVVCIGRTYGSAGTDIGFALADALKINYYDSEIFTEVLERMEADPKSVQDRVSFAHKQNLNQSLGLDRYRGIKARLQEFNRYHGLPTEDALFFNQSGLLCDMAKREDFIIMGRCADVILKDYHPLNLFIYADMEAKVERCIRRAPEGEHLTRNEIERMIKQVDKNRAQYRQMYSDTKWGAKESYHLCVNTTERYMKEIVPGLAAYVRCWFNEE